MARMILSLMVASVIIFTSTEEASASRPDGDRRTGRWSTTKPTSFLDRILLRAKESVRKCYQAEKEIYRLVDMINKMRRKKGLTMQDVRYLHLLADKYGIRKDKTPYYIVYHVLRSHRNLFTSHVKILTTSYVWLQIGGTLLERAGRPLAKRHFRAAAQEIKDAEVYKRTLATYIKLLPQP